MFKASIKNAAVLAIFALLSTALVVTTYVLTKDKIAFHKQQTLVEQLNQVMPHEMYDNDLVASCTLVTNRRYLGSDEPMSVYVAKSRGAQTGVVIETIAPDGYNGDIRMLVGFDNFGRITGVRILEHNETPGLGDKINRRVSDWVDGFMGKRLEIRNNSNRSDGVTSATYRGPETVQLASLNFKQWNVRRDGGQFDGFSGATMTPRAVVKATKKASLLYLEIARTIARRPNNCNE